jgi:hypothetical protein
LNTFFLASVYNGLIGYPSLFGTVGLKCRLETSEILLLKLDLNVATVFLLRAHQLIIPSVDVLVYSAKIDVS